VTIGTRAELGAIRRVGRVVAATLAEMQRATVPGVTTAELDAVAARVFAAHGARSAPQRTYGFPGLTCISVNDEIVHGVPGTRVVRPGDVVKLDVTAELDGFVADAAVTVLVPPAAPDARRVRRAARRAFERALAVARPGVRISELGRVVERTVEAHGCSVLRELTGHGVGRTIHESPSVPNYFSPFTLGVLREGLVIALEPIVSRRPARVLEGADGWTLRTHDRSLAAHHEHTIVITASGAEVVTRPAA
jgi:methionyl aminopeptidase